MATRLKTIKVPVNFGNVTDLTTNVLTALGSPTITIPENSVGNPVTFVSALLYIAAQDTSTATGGSISIFSGTTQLTGAGAATTVAISSATLANSGENWGGIFGPINMTTHFTTNFGTGTSSVAATSATINISTGTGTAIRGVYAWYEITYTYSDTAATRVQTICIPYESQTGTLTTTANTTFCTIPALTGASGWLANHTNATILHRWIEIRGNCNNNNTVTNHNLSYRFDAGTTVVLPTRASALASDTFQIYHVDALTGLSTTATHTFQLWNSLATRWANVIVNEWVTYQYDVSGTTELLNYVELPVDFTAPTPGTTNTVNDRATVDYLLPEPGTITMRNCAVEIDYITNASATVNVRAGAQATYNAYAMASNVCAGQFALQHRLDSGSSLGAALALARGNNTINIDLYRSAGLMSNVTGVIKLLYTSSVSGSGVDSHSKTITPLIRQTSFTTLTDDATPSISITIPETSYYLQRVGIHHRFFVASALMAMSLEARIGASELQGSGWATLDVDSYISDTELSYSDWHVDATPWFKLYPEDPRSPSGLVLGTARLLRTTVGTVSVYSSTWKVTYSSITSTVSGTISGSSGGTVTLDLYELVNSVPTLFDTQTRTGDGSYSFTVYDDTATYYVVAYESATSKGSSKRATPTTGFDISMSSSGGAVTTGYAGG